jgi:hypothetical protein
MGRMHKGYGWEIHMYRYLSEEEDVGGPILQTSGVVEQTGLAWPTIGTRGGVLLDTVTITFWEILE